MTHYRLPKGRQVPGAGTVTDPPQPLPGAPAGLFPAPGDVAMGEDAAAGGMDGSGALTWLMGWMSGPGKGPRTRPTPQSSGSWTGGGGPPTTSPWARSTCAP